METRIKRYIWKNTLTGHWMVATSPRPHDGSAGSSQNRQGFRSWLAAVDEAVRVQTEPEIGEWVAGYDERDGVWREGKLAFHLDERLSVIEQPIPGDSRVYQLDVRRDSLRPGYGVNLG